MTVLGLPGEALSAVVRQLPDNALAASRQAALERFLERGFPTTRSEDWKYTDLSDVAEIGRRWLEGYVESSSLESADERIAEIRASVEAHWIVILNGVPALDSSVELPANVTVAALSSNPELPAHEDALADLNAALLVDGLHITVHGEGSTELPLGILCFDVANDRPSITQTRIVIDVEDGASARLIEYHASAGAADHYANSIVDIALHPDAALDHVRVQDRGIQHSQTHKTTVKLDERSNLSYAGFDLGGRLVRNGLDVDLAGEDADADVGGLYVAGSSQHIDNHVSIDHKVGPARSAQEFKGILGGNCRCVWNGKALVREGADGTDAEQANHNLLLSDKAEIDAKPELEIYADEVKCAHGTTVGQLDESALFYLRSRGLDEQEARNALTHAFGASIVSRVDNRALSRVLTEAVESRLDAIADEAEE
jgi:Fe-S cluster assembly protein SufD